MVTCCTPKKKKTDYGEKEVTGSPCMVRNTDLSERENTRREEQVVNRGEGSDIQH